MTRVAELEGRIETALGRIVAALERQPGSSELARAERAREAGAAEIEALRAELRQMKEERMRDADDVNAILADLRPLLER